MSLIRSLTSRGRNGAIKANIDPAMIWDRHNRQRTTSWLIENPVVVVPNASFLDDGGSELQIAISRRESNEMCPKMFQSDKRCGMFVPVKAGE